MPCHALFVTHTLFVTLVHSRSPVDVGRDIRAAQSHAKLKGIDRAFYFPPITPARSSPPLSAVLRASSPPPHAVHGQWQCDPCRADFNEEEGVFLDANIPPTTPCQVITSALCRFAREQPSAARCARPMAV